MPSSTPSTSAPQLRSNGLNQDAVTWIESTGLFAYTLISATTTNSASVNSSMPSRTVWMRAESSIPR